MVFESNAASVSHAPFIDWYEHQTEWAEGHSYDDPVVSTEKLRAFYHGNYSAISTVERSTLP